MVKRTDILKWMTEKLSSDDEFVGWLKRLLTGQLSADDIAKIAETNDTWRKFEELIGAPGTIEKAMSAPLVRL